MFARIARGKFTLKFKSLPNGKIFQFTPQPGTRYAAIKADGGAYLLHSGEREGYYYEIYSHDRNTSNR